MIKFFRKIRQRLLTENKFSKYLIYAIGEIILVIIGILIALNINIKNAQKQSDKKINIILNAVLEELSINIAETASVFQYYERKDSIYGLIVNNKLSYDDYNEEKFPGLFGFDSQYKIVSLAAPNYKNLMSNADAIPDKYDDIVKDLNSLNEITKVKIDKWNDIIGSFSREALNFKAKNFAGFSVGGIRKVENRDDLIDYMLNDFRYKNSCDLFHNYMVNGAFDNNFRNVLKYRKKAIEIYQQLALALNRPTTHSSFAINQEIIDKVVGEWEMISNPEFRYSIRAENNQLYFTWNKLRFEIYIISDTKSVTDYGGFSTFFKQGSDFVSWENRGRKFKKVSQ